MNKELVVSIDILGAETGSNSPISISSHTKPPFSS